MTKILDFLKQGPPTVLTSIGGVLILASFLKIEKLPGPIAIKEFPSLWLLVTGMVLVLLALSVLLRRQYSTTDLPTPRSGHIAARNVSGEWSSAYKYTETDGRFIEVSETLTITQQQDKIQGKNSGDPDGFEYEIAGVIHHSIFITGTWREVGERPINHGVFQLKISNNSKNMTGMWLGIPLDDKGDITPGDWGLELIPSRD